MAGGRKKKHKGGHEEGHIDERWLLTYADLITLLMSLFMVLWSISSVNISKFEDLQRSLSEAFSGKVMPGGQSIKESGGSAKIQTPFEATQTIQPQQSSEQESSSQSSLSKSERAAAAKHEQEVFEEVKKQVDSVAKDQALSGKVKATITKDGLHIRITTDDLLFASGSAEVKPEAAPLIGSLAKVFTEEGSHQIKVQGHTDNVAITGRYHSNWNLSSDRAANVVNELVRDGVSGGRMESAGKADELPIASNNDPNGRSLNRRVELWLPRVFTDSKQSESITDGVFPGQ